MRDAPPTLVFVYGSLLRGERNHGVLAGATFLGPAWTEARFTLADTGRGYPVLLGGGSTRVRGEVYAVDGALRDAVDRFEGHPRYYTRQEITLDDGRVVFAYVGAEGRVPVVAEVRSGDWRRR